MRKKTANENFLLVNNGFYSDLVLQTQAEPEIPFRGGWLLSVVSGTTHGLTNKTVADAH